MNSSQRLKQKRFRRAKAERKKRKRDLNPSNWRVGVESGNYYFLTGKGDWKRRKLPKYCRKLFVLP